MINKYLKNYLIVYKKKYSLLMNALIPDKIKLSVSIYKNTLFHHTTLLSQLRS